MRIRTIICIQCKINKPSKGRICDKCRYRNRKASGAVAYYEQFKRKKKPPRFYKDRYKAIKYYGSKCMRCGFKKEAGILEVHHKDLNHKNHKINNLILLCPNCHALLHYKSQTGNYSHLGLSKYEIRS